MERLLNEKIEKRLASLPKTPGVYLMHDKNGEVIYVGKARNLTNRVRQYFSRLNSKQAKVAAMVSQIDDFEYIMTDTEIEALILEANLIKQYKPYYNVLMRDDKQYPYIKINTNEDYPRIEIVRKVVPDGAKYFGPYQAAHIIREMLDSVYRLFQMRSCKKNIEKAQQRYERPCMNYQMGRCSAPCAGKISREAYAEIVRDVVDLLSGKHEKLEKKLREEMFKASDERNYELAAIFRDKLKAVERISERQKAGQPNLNDKDVFAAAIFEKRTMIQAFFVRSGKLSLASKFELTEAESEAEALSEFIKQFYETAESIPKTIHISREFEDMELVAQFLSEKKGSKVVISEPKRGDNKKLIDMAKKNAEDELKHLETNRQKEYARTIGAAKKLGEVLGIPYPKRMECFDISNTQGTNSVASMVVFTDGKPDKKEYRRFRIKTVEGPNDFASMAEVLRRRLTEGYMAGDSDHGFGVMPDLIIVDGGKGQLSTAVEVLESMGLENIPIVGLAERNEELFKPYVSESLVLPRASDELRLVTYIRDEAHRFAITYHRSLREKRVLESELDRISGIGDKRKKILIEHFGDIEGIKNADIDSLCAVKGIDIRTARNIYQHFRK